MSGDPLQSEAQEFDTGAMGRVFGASLTFMVSFGVLVPIFPRWAEARGGSLAAVGLATTFAAGVGLIAARPLAARLMEGRARRPLMIAGAITAALASAAFPWVPGFEALLVLRFVQGFGFGLLTTASVSLVTDLAPAEKRGQALGYFGAINALALVAGPASGELIAAWLGDSAAFSFCAGLCLLVLVWLVGLREPPKPAIAGSLRLLEAFVGPMRAITAAHFMALLLHGAILAFLPLRIAQHGGWMTVGAFFALDALVLIVLRVALGRRFDTWGRTPFIMAGLLCLAAAGGLIALGGSDWSFALAGAFYGLGFGAYLPAASALVGDVVPETHRARGFALYMLAFDLSMAMGGLAFGPVADALGLTACFAIAACMPLLALGLHGLRLRQAPL